MKHEQEILARAMCYIDDDMIMAAHGPRKKVRRFVPVLAAACFVAVFIAVFPILREVIDTGSDLLDAPNKGEAIPEEDAPTYSDEQAPIIPGVAYSIGTGKVTLQSATETTVTLTVELTDDTPLYIAFYGLRGDVLATTEPDYKDDGVIIRPETIRLYVDGAQTEVYQLPAAAGTYEVVVDYTTIRNGTYPMSEYVGVYAYTGKNGQAETIRFPLTVAVEHTH